MTIPSPDLDDRTFEELMRDARRWIGQRAPGWTDLSPGDPGITIVEVFAYLTDRLIYRLNQLPRKAYVEFLRLIGLTLRPPRAATVTLRFERERGGERPLEIPRGTRVAVMGSQATHPVVFVTAREAKIPARRKKVDVEAHHCEMVDAEDAGLGTGGPGQMVRVKRPPVIGAMGDGLDLIVGVESLPGELGAREPAIEHEGITYAVWREVEGFADQDPSDRVYVADRSEGVIVFAPALDGGDVPDADGAAVGLAAYPGADRRIRVWYKRGGGSSGNVAAGTITVLKDPIPEATVRNPAAAAGGRDAETLENALLRGPKQIHSISRAVTADDYERLALASGGVSRARASTRASLWRHAVPGTVDVLLVPYLSEEQQGSGRVSAETVGTFQTGEVRDHIQRELNSRRPLGTDCHVNWARHKTVTVRARVVVRREERLEAVRARVQRRLFRTITPLPTDIHPSGWRFGTALRSSHVYDIILKEPGVRFADSVRLSVDEVPDAGITTLVADAFQPDTWFAGGGSTLFRSLNAGEGWEPAGRFPDEAVHRVAVHPQIAGVVAVVTRAEAGSRIHISHDAGETWGAQPQTTAFETEDVSWAVRNGRPLLFLATDVGLYELAIEEGAVPVQVLVTPEDQDRGFWSVVVAVETGGGTTVAVAAQGMGGVFLSSEGGASGSFRAAGQPGDDVRTLAVQRDGPRSFLWAGTASAGGQDNGKGCMRWELRGASDPPEGWVRFSQGWTAGTCWRIAFAGRTAFAATHHGGVLRLDGSRSDAAWMPFDINGGLPLRDPGQFLFNELKGVATDPAGRHVMAAGERGVFRSDDAGASYRTVSEREFSETVTLPPTWLFASGEHEITVIGEDEA